MSKIYFRGFIFLLALFSFSFVGKVSAGEKIWIFIPIDTEGNIKLDGLSEVMNKYFGTFYNVEKYKDKVYELNSLKVFAIKLLNKTPPLKGNVKIYWEKNRIVIETTKVYFLKKRDELSKIFLKIFRVFLKEKESKLQYGLASVPKDFKNKKIVLLVHGIESDNHTWVHFTPFLEEKTISYMFFQYPNDQPIIDSAKLLSKELKAFKEKYPSVSVFAITHSMGGLVTRSVLEDDSLDPGNISSIVMFAPPNHGSYISLLHPLLEFGKVPFVKELTWVDCVFDGMSEAAIDLWPGSFFLTELNKKERNKNCKYQMIVGNKALIQKDKHQLLVKKLKKSLKKSKIKKVIKKRMLAYVSKLTEVINGEGDGAVALERTKLKGIGKVLVVERRHTDIHQIDVKNKDSLRIKNFIQTQYNILK